MKSEFNPARVLLLMRNALFLNKTSIWVIGAALAAILVLLSFLEALNDPHPFFHRNMFRVVFFSCGIWMTTRVFKSLHDPLEGYTWLMLPASSLEKMVSKILMTTVVYMACCLTGYMLVSLASEGVNKVFLGRGHLLFDPFDPGILKSIKMYVAVQAPFLVGAVYFKKHVLSKTILALILVKLGLGACVGLAAWMILGDAVYAQEFHIIFDKLAAAYFSETGSALTVLAKFSTLIVVPLVAWIICYFRHTETEL